ncbi:MAG: protein kinase [Phycisphaeraceae bacterium]|nr:protein kinase [Phycisphaeraceae bacterium]
MEQRRQQIVEEVFLAAADLRERGGDAAAIAGMIAERCRGDDALRAEVESLLGAHEAAEGVLDRADVVLAATGAGTVGGGGRTGRPPWEEPALPPGTVVGGYTLERVLGEGGMGVVYVARQDRPRRTVALKVIRPALTTPAMLRRFEMEAEILGRLQHPGIAQIYEAGIADGRPFLAMELVNGRTLVEHAEHAGLGTRERLELVARVCDAVQHAHQKGVIHRDLKPSNILVDPSTPEPPDGRRAGLGVVGAPKVLDFGVARATDSDLQVSTLRTSLGQLIGTLPYMSPEQVAGDQNEVDTRSDVYALGVILYQLLAGRLPYDVASRSIADAARVIRDEHPSRLSAISRVFRGEIDTIVAKAMDKDRTRRYQSAADLRDDLRRHIAGEPIAAKRDSALYVLRTQLRRYRGTVSAATVFVAALMALTVLAAHQAMTNARLARSLGAELSASNIERGRTLSLAGSATVGENILWRELLARPDSPQARWGLWEHYLHRPIVRSIREDSILTSGVTFSRDRSVAAMGSQSRRVQIWSGDLATLHRTIDTGHAQQDCIAMSPDGSMVAVASATGAVSAWDPRTGAPIGEFAGTDRARVMHFSPDGARLILGCADGAVQVWDAASRSRVAHWTAHPGSLNDLAVSPDGRTLATCGRGPAIRTWTIDRPGEAGPVISTLGREVRTVAYSGDGRRIVALSDGGAIGVYPATADDGPPTLLDRTGPALHRFTISDDGKLLAAGGSGTVELWDMAQGVLLRTLTRNDGAEYRAHAITRDGMIITSASNGRVQVWEHRDALAAHDLLPEHAGWISAIAVSADGSRWVSADLAREVRLWDAASGRELARPEPRAPTVCRAMQFSLDGRLLALGYVDGSVEIRSSADLSIVRRLSMTGSAGIESLDWSPDGARLLAGNGAGGATVLDPHSGAQVASIPAPERPRAPGAAPVRTRRVAAAWSADGRLIALASADPTLRVLDAASLATVFEIEGEHLSWACAFCDNGGALAVAMPSNEIHLFDTRTWKRFATLEGHSKVILSVAFAPDGQLLASCGLDGSVRLWDSTRRRNERADGSSISGRNLATIWSGPMEVSRVVFSADGRTLLTGGADRRLIAWDLRHYDRHIAGNLDVHLRRAVDRGEVSAGRAAATRSRVLRHLQHDPQSLPGLAPDP